MTRNKFKESRAAVFVFYYARIMCVSKHIYAYVQYTYRSNNPIIKCCMNLRKAYIVTVI